MWPHCEFHLPTPFSACCWHHCVNKNTIFLSSSPGHAVPFISLSLSLFCGRWGNNYEGLEGSGTRVSCGKPECSLWLHSMCPPPPAPPFLLYLCFPGLQWITGGSMQIAYYGLKWYGSLCVVPFACQRLLPLRSLWHGPSLSWSPGYPGWSFAVGPGESWPQTGWSCASRSSHLKTQMSCFIFCRCHDAVDCVQICKNRQKKNTKTNPSLK